MSYHPGRQALERFARGEIFRHEARRIVEHLRSGCRVCQRELDGLLPLAGDGMAFDDPLDLPARGGTDGAWPRLDLRHLKDQLARALREREEAPALTAELLALSAAGRHAAVRSDRRYRTVAVCDRLVDESFRAGFFDPSEAVALAELAIELTDKVDPETYGRSVVIDLKGRVWGFLGNARRVSSDRRGAEDALELAQSLIDEGSADPLEQARILDFKASLSADRGRFEDAVELLDMVIDIYREIREPHWMGRALLSKGVVLGHQGDPDGAAALLLESITLLDLDREPHLLIYAHHNFAWFADEAGRHEEAQEHFERIAPLYDTLADAATEVRRIWLQGRIAAGLERFAEAESALREVQRRFTEQGLAYDAAVVTMDLAALLLDLGRNREVAEIAAETFPILVAQQVHHHTLAALVAFTHALEMDCATPELARQISAFLLRASRNPRLQFQARR
jgi:tetratricopeptide (TPR) repeat protein